MVENKTGTLRVLREYLRISPKSTTVPGLHPLAKHLHNAGGKETGLEPRNVQFLRDDKIGYLLGNALQK